MQLEEAAIAPISSFFECWWSNDVLSNLQQNYRDFVLISEFSELEGPLPLAVVTNTDYIELKSSTVQDELQKLHLDRFDFNTFVLRVVSTDRSADNEYRQQDEVDDEDTTKKQEEATQRSDPNPSPPPPTATWMFSVPDDTQVYFSDSENGFYAFTHHLTLFDINARGYVHPVALSFVTRDPDKIVLRFEEFMEKFNDVSQLMKKGNFANFTLDLKCRLLDLEHTRVELRNTKKHPSVCMPDEALQQAITVIKLIVDTIEPYSIQTNIDSDPVEDDTGIVEPPKSYKPAYIDTLYPVAHFERKLRTLAQLCQEPYKEEDSSISCKRANLLQTNMFPLASSIEPRPKEISLRRRRSFATAIAHDMYAEATKYLADVIQDLGSSSVALDVDEEETPMLEPMSDTITIGRTLVLNMDNPHPRTHDHAGPEDGKLTPNELSASADTNVSLRKDKENKPANKHTEASGQHVNDTYFPVVLVSSQLRDTAQGNSLLEILQQYHGCIHHVLFSILTGRHVVVVGNIKTKSKVEAVVIALSSFIPRHTREHHGFVPWLSHSKLTDSLLSSVKVIGTDKDNVDSSVHRLEISYFEIDPPEGNLVTSPLYLDGVWIHQLLDKLKFFTTDMAFLAYAHTVFMTMALKAYVYRHLCLVEFQGADASSLSPSKKSPRYYLSESSTEGSSEVSKKWSVRHIMNYLQRIEARENEQGSCYASTPSFETSVQAQNMGSQQGELQKREGCETEENKESFSDENEATVTLQSVRKPISLASLHWGATAPDITSPEERQQQRQRRRQRRRESVYSDSTSSISSFGLPLYFEEEIVNDDDLGSSSDESDNRSSDAEVPQFQLPDMSVSDEIPPKERLGRRFLQEKLKVYGDDQSIVVYLAKYGVLDG